MKYLSNFLPWTSDSQVDQLRFVDYRHIIEERYLQLVRAMNHCNLTARIDLYRQDSMSRKETSSWEIAQEERNDRSPILLQDQIRPRTLQEKQSSSKAHWAQHNYSRTLTNSDSTEQIDFQGKVNSLLQTSINQYRTKFKLWQWVARAKLRESHTLRRTTDQPKAKNKEQSRVPSLHLK